MSANGARGGFFQPDNDLRAIGIEPTSSVRAATLKYDDLNLERFKVLMEFVEYFKTRGDYFGSGAAALE
jgi:hypothetical protein